MPRSLNDRGEEHLLSHEQETSFCFAVLWKFGVCYGTLPNTINGATLSNTSYTDINNYKIYFLLFINVWFKKITITFTGFNALVIAMSILTGF